MCKLFFNYQRDKKIFLHACKVVKNTGGKNVKKRRKRGGSEQEVSRLVGFVSID